MVGARVRLAVRLLSATAAIQIAFALALPAHDVRHLIRGEVSWHTVSGLAGLIWMPILVGILWWTARQMGWFDRRSVQDAASIAAAGAISHEWHWETTTDLVVTYSNHRLHDLLGVQATEIVGRRLTALLADPDSLESRQALDAAIRTGVGWHDIEVQWRHTDGRLVTLAGSGSALRDSCGRIVGLRGAGRTRTATGEDRAHNERRARVQAILKEGAGAHGVQVALQRIQCLQTRHVVGFEALARFADCSPERMFADAETVGLGLDLELLAIRCALPLLDQIPADTHLSINASPDLLLDSQLAELLAQSPGQLPRLVVEVTERLPVSRYDELHAVLAPLREQGLRVAVDDTGAGYASFAHVLRLRPNIIKLDRSLISDIDTDPAQRSLVTAVALLALDLDATLTAEGVETAAQLDVLTNLGIDHGQGYHLGKPTLSQHLGPRRSLSATTTVTRSR